MQPGERHVAVAVAVSAVVASRSYTGDEGTLQRWDHRRRRTPLGSGEGRAAKAAERTAVPVPQGRRRGMRRCCWGPRQASTHCGCTCCSRPCPSWPRMTPAAKRTRRSQTAQRVLNGRRRPSPRRCQDYPASGGRQWPALAGWTVCCRRHGGETAAAAAASVGGWPPGCRRRRRCRGGGATPLGSSGRGDGRPPCGAGYRARRRVVVTHVGVGGGGEGAPAHGLAGAGGRTGCGGRGPRSETVPGVVWKRGKGRQGQDGNVRVGGGAREGPRRRVGAGWKTGRAGRPSALAAPPV